MTWPPCLPSHTQIVQGKDTFLGQMLKDDKVPLRDSVAQVRLRVDGASPRALTNYGLVPTTSPTYRRHDIT